MSIEDEKQIVRSLYSSGLTIHQIAAQIGRSASWVYTRLSDKYTPNRRRDTVDVPPEAVREVAASQPWAEELETVRSMRSSGMTYQEIAEKLNRSIYWVHSRLRGKYQPRSVRTEILFQEQAVVPWLQSIGHVILSQCERFTYDEFVLEADIISTLGADKWITEVKVSANGHELHTAIGQLVLHRCLPTAGAPPRLQIALPISARPQRMSEAILRALATKESIEVAFVPWEASSKPVEGAAESARGET